MAFRVRNMKLPIKETKFSALQIHIRNSSNTCICHSGRFVREEIYQKQYYLDFPIRRNRDENKLKLINCARTTIAITLIGCKRIWREGCATLIWVICFTLTKRKRTRGIRIILLVDFPLIFSPLVIPSILYT